MISFVNVLILKVREETMAEDPASDIVSIVGIDVVAAPDSVAKRLKLVDNSFKGDEVVAPKELKTDVLSITITSDDDPTIVTLLNGNPEVPNIILVPSETRDELVGTEPSEVMISALDPGNVELAAIDGVITWSLKGDDEVSTPVIEADIDDWISVVLAAIDGVITSSLKGIEVSLPPVEAGTD